MNDEVGDDVTLAALVAEEAQLQFARFTYDDAWAIGTALVKTGRTRSLPVTVDITRGGQQLFHAALSGSTPDNDAWVQRKVRTVLRFGRSSLYVSVVCRDAGVSLADFYGLDPQLFAAAGGGFPVHVEGAGVVGTITASGLRQVEDHKLVTCVVREFLRQT